MYISIGLKLRHPITTHRRREAGKKDQGVGEGAVAGGMGDTPEVAHRVTGMKEVVQEGLRTHPPKGTQEVQAAKRAHYSLPH